MTQTLEAPRPSTLPESPELAAALAQANLPTLLAACAYLSQDSAFLERFAPFIRPAFSHNPTAIPDDLAAELRSKLHRLLTTGDGLGGGSASDELMLRIMTVTAGEPVESEFLELVYDQCGFRPWIDRSAIQERRAPPSGFKVLVIGAGMTGMAAAIKLREAGYDCIVVEKNSEVGGTWFENRYPGVGVDTPSHFYSYSWEIWPDWQHYHPRGADMQRYMVEIADKYDLRGNIRFDTKVESLVYSERDANWTVTVRNENGSSETIVANAVINGHGPVNRYKWPDIAGLQDFSGTVVHTAAWPEGLDLKGKRVAIIGTGASSAQLAGAIAPEVAQLTVYQRTKHWVIHNPEIAHEVNDGMKWALANIPSFKEWFRFRVYWSAADGLFANVLKDPAWEGNDLAVSEYNEQARQYALWYLGQKFADRPDLIAKLTPDFPIFSKRIILDNGWFDALNRPNVHLEDQGIARILSSGIEAKDGSVSDCDVIVCATGFNVAKMTGDLVIKGIDGRDLGEEWGEEDPRSYLGMCIPGYPNYFHTVGPNSAPNHAAGQNLISEAQVNWIIEALDRTIENDARAFEVTQEAFDAWNRKVEKRMPEMIWTHPKASSYYNNSKGRVFLSWPWRLVEFFNETRRPEDGSYHLHA
ncbi:NAD(P)/FAD-dependent oxidoreductase [Novosphingobium sp. P6W]|uniref:flavin-containing monooxygenase n=1 Tax=Novosphingobium sp. P6W TaxID=1609758 RepID=UPI0005C30D6C|nr:NAD(P)/FAD-dependent oxidoreductase [Novosphingobium sp. P6W]AXB80353.1 NAD(P)/FAD-dependent oxidoreductase [Novosphingobium sp. P6W]KIS29951.1 FAD-dependent oxidoreductase [Novosphingobium sp. P6W]